ncbi:beta-ketoacyl synthase N-terminal-like domain-containing protein [Calothrix sp. CCY 0018]|uniref:beta-ketoacyl synthase N-terminal-like domain-containing protein n=1 Tax=Calothrix sp. CCY 0018 TaxID=3103864 RepID=UPI0039C5F901
MLTNKIGAALAQFHKEIDNCERAILDLIKLKNMTSESVKLDRTNTQLQQTPIAIIGMGSLFPQAKNLQEYWEKIIAGVDCITDVPASRWNVKDYYDPDPKAPDKTYCKRGGFIPDIEFNPMEFGLPPNQLEVTDISQLLALVVAKQALCDAGYDSDSGFNHERTGVVLGVALARQLTMPLAARLQYPVWEKVLKSQGLSDEDTQNIIEKIKSAYINWDTNAFPGMLANVVTGRIANRFDFGGTNCVVDAACASSLGALSMAISELADYRADMMLTGGVDTDNSIVAYMCFSKTPAVTPGENVKPFDAESNGMMLGEGVGMILLKRLEDAERDRDKIYAVIRGVGTSSDGRHKSIYAPRAEGQMKALERAYERAGFTPRTVGLIEAHGTGTMAGDPAEFAALKAVFGKDNASEQSVALGSVKSQIGHTKAAAGAASLIKTALALHHKVLPPTINVNKPNPKLEIESSPFYLNTQTRPWLQAGETPRRAGVSSFGFGGTNYHIVLEEYCNQNQQFRINRTPQEILLSAPSPEQLLQECESALIELKSDQAESYFKELVNRSKSVQIPVTAARLGFVADSVVESIKKLQISINWFNKQPEAENWQLPQGVYYRKQGMDLQGKVVALFSGQGSQYLEMGREIVMNFPVLQQTYNQVDRLFCKSGLSPISEKVFPAPVFDSAQKQAQTQALQQTEISQPAIAAFSVGLYKVLQQAGFKPDIVAGHSFGELTALWAAEVLSDEDYFYLVKERGQAMAKPDDSSQDMGAMLAVKGDVAKVKQILSGFPEVKLANCNSPFQVVLAGATDKIAELKQVLTDKGFSAISLPVSGAFHTSLIARAEKPFTKAIGKVTFNTPKIPIYTNTTATVYPQESEAIRKNLQAHISNSVLFEQEIENIYDKGGYCFVEFGPRSILTNLVGEILGSRPHMAIALNGSRQKDSDSQLREAVVQLRVAGLELAELDPHQLELKSPEVKSNKALNVTLGCHNYVSDKTKAAFTKALENTNGNRALQNGNGRRDEGLVSANGNGHSSNGNGSSQNLTLVTSANGESTPVGRFPPLRGVVNPEGNGHYRNGNGSLHNKDLVTAKIASATKSSTALKEKLPVEQTMTSIEGNSRRQNGQSITTTVVDRKLAAENKLESALPNPELIASIESSIEQFSQTQSQTLEVHGQYLDNQQEYVQACFQLMQQQSALFSNIAQSGKTQPVERIIESVERSMMQVHKHQADTLQIHQQYLRSQVESTGKFYKLTQKGYSHLVEDDYTQPLISRYKVVIDSDITEPVSQNEQSIDNQSLPVTFAEPEVENNSPKIEPQKVNIDFDTLSQALLAVVSDKTGYPSEMLELDMDIEADLGIDSIKRVEIIGALQEQVPDLPQPNLEEMAEVELRTLGQIVDYMRSLTEGGTGNLTPQPPSLRSRSVSEGHGNGENLTDNLTEQLSSLRGNGENSTEDSKPLSLQERGLERGSQNVIDSDTLSQTLLEVVSDKTGYPSEMLELDMDIEADLGIDSIKRVEIIGALQEQVPDLPQPNLEEMAEVELRTLGQIVDYMQSLTTETEKKKQSDTVDDGQPNLEHNIQRAVVKQKFLPPPDKLEFDLPANHICLLTDDGSQLTCELAQSLQHQGWKVVVLCFPQLATKSSLPQGIERVMLQNGSDEQIKTQLAEIQANYGQIATFMHLNPSEHQDAAIIKQVFFLAKHLKNSLTKAAKLGRSCFITVTRLDGELGCSGKGDINPVSGGLFGLTKSLRWEWQSVFCRAIDINPELDNTTATQHIIAELHDPNRLITEVGYGARRITVSSEQ